MIHKTKGIVLHRFKYSDSKYIAKIYTKQFGLQSYMVFGANSKKGRMQINLLQPLFPLDMQVYHKETVELQKVKEIAVLYPVNSFSVDIIKNSLAVFIAEFILKTLKENDADEKLFEFILNSIKILESLNENMNNFHLVFFFQLSKYLGIKPENNYSETHKIFDLQSGRFVVGNPTHKNFLNEKISKKFSDLFYASLEQSNKLKLSVHERRYLLDTIIKFYNIHLDRPGELKSLKVLSEVFS